MCAKLAINGGPRTVPKDLQKPWPPITQDDIDAVVAVPRYRNSQPRRV